MRRGRAKISVAALDRPPAAPASLLREPMRVRSSSRTYAVRRGAGSRRAASRASGRPSRPGRPAAGARRRGDGKTRVLASGSAGSWSRGQARAPGGADAVVGPRRRDARAARERAGAQLRGAARRALRSSLRPWSSRATPGADAARLDRRPPGERFAMLIERIDELSIRSHDFGGSATALLTGFVRKIDRLKAHLIGAEDYARVGGRLGAGAEPGEARAGARVLGGLQRPRADAGRGRRRGRRRPAPRRAADDPRAPATSPAVRARAAR